MPARTTGPSPGPRDGSTASPGTLLDQVAAARASGLSRSLDGRWRCPTGEIVLVLGNRVADNVGRLEWNLRPYWPGTRSRRLRAAVDGRDVTGRLKYDSNEITRSDGDVWKRALPPGRAPAPLPEAGAPEDCIASACERMQEAEAKRRRSPARAPGAAGADRG